MICSFLCHKSFHASSASCKANIKVSRCKKTAGFSEVLAKTSNQFNLIYNMYTVYVFMDIIHVSVFQRLLLTILSTMGDVMSSVADLLNKNAVHFGRAEMDLLSSFVYL